LPTGDELVPPGGAPARGTIVDTNSLMLAAQAVQSGAVVERRPIVRDDPELLAQVAQELAARCDLLLVNAGSSAGADDHTAAMVERLGTLAVHGVAVRPGH